MNKTKIEWADYTWNPVTGCRHGCPYCYARRNANRFGKMLQDCSGYPETHGGLHCLESKIEGNPYPYIFEPTFLPFRLDEPARKEKSQTIFVCSMSDLFGGWVPYIWIESVFAACARAPQHTYMFLTKNPMRYRELQAVGKLPDWGNMWYGYTMTGIPDEFLFNGRSNRFNTFISVEPLLAPLDRHKLEIVTSYKWIIIGAETGNRKEKIKPKKEWIDEICRAAGNAHVPVFMKNSLIDIVGEENMRREFPWEVKEK